jgi:hypothetical protein
MRADCNPRAVLEGRRVGIHESSTMSTLEHYHEGWPVNKEGYKMH